MLEQKSFEMEFAGKKLSVRTGKVANQVSSCLVSYGDTVILATAVMGKTPRMGMDFFPLQIEVREKMYAAGKIKGSKFIKGEGRPTDNAVLTGRMIDRGIRPLFNQEIRNEVQLVSTSLSYDGENSFQVLSITAASLALHLSSIPWNGPLVGINVGRVDGQLVANPTKTEMEKSDLNLILSISNGKVMMVDAYGSEVSESDMERAFEFAIESAKPLTEFVEKIKKEVGLEKKDEQELVESAIADAEVPLAEKKEVFEEAKKFFAPQLDKYLFNQPVGTKRERKEIAKVLLNEFVEKLEKEEKHEEIIAYVKNSFESYLEEEVTKAILEKDLRVDGRTLEQIRPLSAETGILPRTHGTGLFSRGETQVLTITTLGAPGDAMIQDEMTQDDTKKSYIHFYNSPPYSFGEPGRFMGAGRREIGHGALAEKALIPVLPSKEDFPYTIILTSEVMGSNGSSSMGSTCGSTLSLMDAGVPIKKPVAGIAMGLASNGDDYKILTDLQDLEDGEGGMDFKITGTRDGITAIQMDTKTNGLGLELCKKTLTQSRKALNEIIDVIEGSISKPRKELSKYAPNIIAIKIDPEKIGAVIGGGGKTINEIIDICGVQIDIDDDGTVSITGVGNEGVDKAREWVEKLVKDVEPGEIYEGKVVRLMDFGAFVELLPGKDGMVHISEFSNERIDKITDVASVGKMLKVKVLEVDPSGKIKLSVKQADPDYKHQKREFGGGSRDGGGKSNYGSRGGFKK
jgi:polyribonucleotide nucleotidyltransferase